MRINEITQEQKVNVKCLISKCDKGKTVKDTPYLSLILEDATGVLDAKFWNLTNEQIEQYKVGQIDAINDVLPELPPSPYLMRKDEKKAQRIRHTK